MTECVKCGDCCERIWMKGNALARSRAIVDYLAWEGASVDDLMQHDWEREQAEQLLSDPNDRRARDARFILEHWHAVETVERPDEADCGAPKVVGHYHSCDRFDPQTRLCMAHDERPPVCEGFPWYGDDPAAVAEEQKVPFMSPRCSFVEDVPVAFRAKVIRPS